VPRSTMPPVSRALRFRPPGRPGEPNTTSDCDRGPSSEGRRCREGPFLAAGAGASGGGERWGLRRLP
jgi:hypothetical protein